MKLTDRQVGSYYVFIANFHNNNKTNSVWVKVGPSLKAGQEVVMWPLAVFVSTCLMKGSIHLSPPMKRYVTTFASQGNSLQVKGQKSSINARLGLIFLLNAFRSLRLFLTLGPGRGCTWSEGCRSSVVRREWPSWTVGRCREAEEEGLDSSAPSWKRFFKVKYIWSCNEWRERSKWCGRSLTWFHSLRTSPCRWGKDTRELFLHPLCFLPSVRESATRGNRRLQIYSHSNPSRCWYQQSKKVWLVTAR